MKDSLNPDHRSIQELEEECKSKDFQIELFKITGDPVFKKMLRLAQYRASVRFSKENEIPHIHSHNVSAKEGIRAVVNELYKLPFVDDVEEDSGDFQFEQD